MPKHSNHEKISNPAFNPILNDKDENDKVDNKDGNLFTLKYEPPKDYPKDLIKPNQVDFKKNKKGCCLIL